MLKQQIIDHLTHKCGLHGASSIAAVNGMIDCIRASLCRGEDVILRGLGTFKIIETQQKQGRHFTTREPLLIQPCKRVRFIPAKDIKSIIKELPVDCNPGSSNG